MKIASGFCVLLFELVSGVLVCAQQKLEPEEAKSHVGEQATVCGSVRDVHYAEHTKGKPTLIYLDRSYPGEVFAILIAGRDRPKLGDPERRYSAKRVCVTGMIATYNDVPAITARNPEAIKVQE